MEIKRIKRLSVVKSNLSHVENLCYKLRKEDIYELNILGITPRYALAYPFTQEGAHTYSLLCDKKVIGMFGTVPDKGMINARVWLLVSDEFKKHKVSIYKGTKDMINLLQSDYTLIYNIIPLKNHITINWLMRSGFSFSEPYKLKGKQFVEFFRCNLKENIIYNEESRPVMH